MTASKLKVPENPNDLIADFMGFLNLDDWTSSMNTPCSLESRMFFVIGLMDKKYRKNISPPHAVKIQHIGWCRCTHILFDFRFCQARRDSFIGIRLILIKFEGNVLKPVIAPDSYYFSLPCLESFSQPIICTCTERMLNQIPV